MGYRVSPQLALSVKVHRWGVALINLLVRVLYGQSVRDEACCYKVGRPEDYRRMELESDGFECCPEIVAKACRLRLRIRHVPVAYFPRSAREGKKLRLTDGARAVWALFRYRRWKERESTKVPASVVESSSPLERP